MLSLNQRVIWACVCMLHVMADLSESKSLIRTSIHGSAGTTGEQHENAPVQHLQRPRLPGSSSRLGPACLPVCGARTARGRRVSTSL